MYYSLESKIISWNDRLVQAKLVNEDLAYQPHWWLCDPVVTQLPLLKFAIDPAAPKPDNYWTGMEIDLYSARLINILRDMGVRFETFPVMLIDKTTSAAIDVQYKAFHLLDMYPVSKLRARDEQGKIVSISAPVKMFRLQKYINQIIIHQDLKLIFDSSDIQGFSYRSFK
jgi:hypothetical protein